MEGSSDPTKLVSQFLLRKTLVQVRRRILQCCRPGVPDNIVKAFRYQHVLWPMPAVCRRVDPTEQRPPLEREEDAMPPWLLRSLPVIYAAVTDYNRSPGSAPEAPRPRHGHMTSYSFPPGTRYPPRLPKQLDFRRIGFLLLQKPRPLPTHSPPDAALAVSMTTTEQIRRHYQTLVGLRKKRRRRGRASAAAPEEAPPPNPGGPAHSEGDDVMVLSESSPSSTGSDDCEEAESEREQEVTLLPSRAAEEEEESVLRLQESSDYEEDQSEEAQDYLLRVCDAVQGSPGVSDQLLLVLDQFSGRRVAAERLYAALRRLLQPWPQLLRDFAAFLTRSQARRCGLLTEQQQFERSRRFLRRLARSLGGGSALYQQVVSALQRGSTPPPEELHQISSLLRRHSDLQQEFWEFFQQLHGRPSPAATNHTESDYASQNPPDGNRKGREQREEQTGSDGEREEEEKEEQPVGAQNISLTSTGEKVVVWTREADRTILTSCQQRGANRKTFRQVSAQLGNKTAQQVSLRFHDLMNLFHSAFQKPTSCSSKGPPISR
ncbi:GON-4-like protein [Sander lucioperca]|uniref:GON-4-like protein n=1 Tax=Sander lucioperca TaxID=283035 RepID=UPI001653C9DC|nr:GON-4-like protein [Sander lucioperca]